MEARLAERALRFALSPVLQKLSDHHHHEAAKHFHHKRIGHGPEHGVGARLEHPQPADQHEK